MKIFFFYILIRKKCFVSFFLRIVYNIYFFKNEVRKLFKFFGWFEYLFKINNFRVFFVFCWKLNCEIGLEEGGIWCYDEIEKGEMGWLVGWGGNWSVE